MPGTVKSRGSRKSTTKKRSSSKDGASARRARPFLPPAALPHARIAERIFEFEPVPVLGGKGALIRNRIGSRALDLFAANGFEGTSTRGIAQRLGIQHSLLLYHFGSKSSLWQYVMAGMVKHYRTAVAAKMPTDTPHHPEVALRRVIDAHVDFTCEFPQFHKIMMMESTQAGNKLPWLIVNQLHPHYELVMALILAGQKRSTVRPLDPVRLYYTIIGVAGTLSSAAPEIEQLTQVHVFSPAEKKRTKEFLAALVFTDMPS